MLVLQRYKMSQASFRIFAFTALAMSVAGEYFYKFKFLGIYATELIIIGLVLAALPFKKNQALIFEDRYFLGLFIILSVYLVVSLGLDRDIDLLIRQGVIILYLCMFFLGGVFSETIFKETGSADTLLKSCFFVGFFLVLFSKLGSMLGAIPGNSMMPASIVFFLGSAYYFSRSKTIFSLLARTTLSVSVMLISNSHTAFLGAILVISMVIAFYRAGRYRAIILLVSLFAIISFLAIGEGFSDYNAVWRFLYWKDLIWHHWNTSYLLLGAGFGEGFLRESMDNFTLLISQVSNEENFSQQLDTVPPHNALLVLLNYGGIAAAILFLSPYFICLKKFLHKGNIEDDLVAIFAALTGALVIALSNQCVEVPYGAFLLFALYGYVNKKFSRLD